MEPGKLALVLSGGGTSGAVEVGFWKAIQEFGIVPDLIVGTSVGAVNGAMIAAGMDADAMHHAWRATSRRSFLRFNWTELWHGLAARSLFSEAAFREFLHGLPARDFAGLKIPLVCVATDLKTGEVVTLDHGDLIRAVQASAAIPGIFPPVWLDGRQLADGGLMRQVPLDVAVARGATTVIVALAECRSDAAEPARNVVETIFRAFSIMASRSVRTPGYLERFAGSARIVLLEPCFTIRITPRNLLDLENTDILVKFGYEFAKARLEQEGFARPKGAQIY